MAKEKIAVIIPAWNEENSIASVIRAIPIDLKAHIIVIDNMSTDKTRSIAENLGTSVISNPVRNYDYQCFIGAQAARGFDILVFLHAGGDDDPKDIIKLIKPIIDDKADLVIGSRTQTKDGANTLALHQYLGTRLITLLINLIFRTEFTDNGPFRAIKSRTYDNIAMKPRRFSWTTQMLVKCLKEKCRIIEIPIVSRLRVGKSKISGSFKNSFLAMIDMLWSLKFAF